MQIEQVNQQISCSVEQSFLQMNNNLINQLKNMFETRKLYVMFETGLNCEPTTDHITPKNIYPIFEETIQNCINISQKSQVLEFSKQLSSLFQIFNEKEHQQRINFEDQLYSTSVNLRKQEEYNNYLSTQLQSFQENLEQLVSKHTKQMFTANQQIAKAKSIASYQPDHVAYDSIEALMTQIKQLNNENKQQKLLNQALQEEQEKTRAKLWQQQNTVLLVEKAAPSPFLTQPEEKDFAQLQEEHKNQIELIYIENANILNQKQEQFTKLQNEFEEFKKGSRVSQNEQNLKIEELLNIIKKENDKTALLLQNSSKREMKQNSVNLPLPDVQKNNNKFLTDKLQEYIENYKESLEYIKELEINNAKLICKINENQKSKPPSEYKSRIVSRGFGKTSIDEGTGRGTSKLQDRKLGSMQLYGLEQINNNNKQSEISFNEEQQGFEQLQVISEENNENGNNVANTKRISIQAQNLNINQSEVSQKQLAEKHTQPPLYDYTKQYKKSMTKQKQQKQRTSSKTYEQKAQTQQEQNKEMKEQNKPKLSIEEQIQLELQQLEANQKQNQQTFNISKPSAKKPINQQQILSQQKSNGNNQQANITNNQYQQNIKPEQQDIQFMSYHEDQNEQSQQITSEIQIETDNEKENQNTNNEMNDQKRLSTSQFKQRFEMQQSKNDPNQSENDQKGYIIGPQYIGPQMQDSLATLQHEQWEEIHRKQLNIQNQQNQEYNADFTNNSNINQQSNVQINQLNNEQQNINNSEYQSQNVQHNEINQTINNQINANQQISHQLEGQIYQSSTKKLLNQQIMLQPEKLVIQQINTSNQSIVKTNIENRTQQVQKQDSFQQEITNNQPLSKFVHQNIYQRNKSSLEQAKLQQQENQQQQLQIINQQQSFQRIDQSKSRNHVSASPIIKQKQLRPSLDDSVRLSPVQQPLQAIQNTNESKQVVQPSVQAAKLSNQSINNQYHQKQIDDDNNETIIQGFNQQCNDEEEQEEEYEENIETDRLNTESSNTQFTMQLPNQSSYQQSNLGLSQLQLADSYSVYYIPPSSFIDIVEIKTQIQTEISNEKQAEEARQLCEQLLDALVDCSTQTELLPAVQRFQQPQQIRQHRIIQKVNFIFNRTFVREDTSIPEVFERLFQFQKQSKLKQQELKKQLDDIEKQKTYTTLQTKKLITNISKSDRQQPAMRITAKTSESGRKMTFSIQPFTKKRIHQGVFQGTHRKNIQKMYLEEGEFLGALYELEGQKK
ncbi:Coiled-coil_protein [Hexamita inflata]|uniref:Coiled-coil protein n=1 Tax=Hexamita inflata TaxID=28002 RepID=A0AA86UUK0_9EUKA|nr:Coiled-coil protein [Hexamita inflata]